MRYIHLTYVSQALWNPGPDGQIVPSGRTADINAPAARYPFEVSLLYNRVSSGSLIFLEDHYAPGRHRINFY